MNPRHNLVTDDRTKRAVTIIGKQRKYESNKMLHRKNMCFCKKKNSRRGGFLFNMNLKSQTFSLKRGVIIKEGVFIKQYKVLFFNESRRYSFV